MLSNKPPNFHPCGDGAILLTFADAFDLATNRYIHQLAAALKAQQNPAILDLVPAYTTLLIHFNPLQLSHAEARQWVQQQLTAIPADALPAAQLVEIPVVYGGTHGMDLDDMAQHLGFAPAEIIALHSHADYHVAMMGFTPGFAYLSGLDALLAMPRLATPRTCIPAGAVGIAGNQTGIYPLASPGGWRLIGRTPAKLFDPARTPPFLISPGDVVRFIPIEAGACHFD